MGIFSDSQEKQNVKDLSKTIEGKSILEISNSSFEQNIYVCGNYELKFFENNIIKASRYPEKLNVKYYIKMGKHKEITDWHFFFAPKVNNYNEMMENTKLFIKDHNDFQDFDDFGEGSKTRSGKIVIVYFNDDYKDNFVKYFVNKHNKYDLPLFIIVGKEKENKELKDDIKKAIKGLRENRAIDPNIFKFTNFTDDAENNLINLNFNLIKCSAFYNQLDDELIYPKQLMDDNLFDKVVNEKIKNFSTLNILICGRAGAGKSTFINWMLHTTVCKIGVCECTQRILKYIHRSLPITFYDSPGMTTDEIVDSIIELIKTKNSELGQIQSKIHAVFYIFDGSQTRFYHNSESKMFKLLLKEYKIPLYLIATRLKSKEEYEGNKGCLIKNFCYVIKEIEEFIDPQYRKENIANKIFCVNVIGNSFSEADKLFEKMYNDFKKYIIYEKITKYNIEEKTGNNSLIPKLYKPKDIIFHPVKLCEHITLMYRLIARSINSEKKGSTLLSSLYLRIISNIFCKEKLSLSTCKAMISNMNFDLDEEKEKNKKEYKSWFRSYYGYMTPAEEEISFLADKYINLYKEELQMSEEKCLEYINKLRKSLNEAIEGLKLISKEFS